MSPPIVVDERALARVRALVELAADPRTPEHEAAAAAVQACRRIKRDGLTLGAGRVGPAPPMMRQEPVVRFAEPLLVVFESPKSYRVAFATSETRHRGSPVAGWVPKRLVVPGSVAWMAPEEARRRYGTAGRVIASFDVFSRNADAVRRAVRRTDAHTEE